MHGNAWDDAPKRLKRVLLAVRSSSFMFSLTKLSTYQIILTTPPIVLVNFYVFLIKYVHRVTNYFLYIS